MAGALRSASASFDRLPIRVRLAGVSALLTFVILCAFAIGIGSFTVHRVRSDFNRELERGVRTLTGELSFAVSPDGRLHVVPGGPNLDDYALPNDASV
ncbi:MAG: hypothetical protein QOI18_923, partial [Solirubrobacteraceae bacterium]|nr:hypothetical protein [Solirubrobacteraceae bacterium]